MKRFFYLAALAALALPAAAQQCVVSFNFTTATSSAAFNNLTRGCVNWTVTFNSTGFTGLTFTVQTAPNNGGVPGAWSTFTPVTGNNPSTATTQASATFSGYFPFVRVTLSGLTGTGTVSGLLYGAWPADGGGGGGGGGCTSPCVVVGPDAVGSPSTEPPVQVAGNDGTNVRAIKTDTGGNTAVVGSTADGGSTVGLQPVVIGGQASGNLVRQFGLLDTLTDASATGGRSLAVGPSLFDGTNWNRMRGNLLGAWVQGPAANGAANAAAGNPLRVCGFTGGGTTGVCTSIRVGSQGSLELQGSAVALADGASNSPTLPSYDGAAGGSARSYTFGFNGTNWDRVRSSIAGGLQMGGFGSGASPGTIYGLTLADSSAAVAVGAGATTEIVPLTASRSIRVTSFAVTGDTAAGTFKFVRGTGTNCGSGTADVSGAFNVGVSTGVSLGNGAGELFKLPAGEALCITTVTSAAAGIVGYAKF